MDCSVARSLEVIGEWWTLLILRDAFLGCTRFEDFQKRLGIARNVLSARLNTLVEADVLERVAYQERPERFEYLLTASGKELFPVVTGIRQWGDKWLSEGEPPLVLEHLECGHEAWFVPKCSHCGGELTHRNVRTLVPGRVKRRPRSGDESDVGNTFN